MTRMHSGIFRGKDGLRFVPAWVLVALPAALMRLPVFLLPAPGRDEAVYSYWSRFPEPAYAPLMQWLISATALLPLPDVQALRLAFFVAGLLVLFLYDILLRDAGLSRAGRMLALSALAFSPWQTYTGALAHPDALFLAAILLFVLCMRRGYLPTAAFFAGLTVLSKPTGVVVLAVALLCFLLDERYHFRRRLACAALALLVAAPVLFSFSREMLLAIAEFGKMSENVSLWGKLNVAGLSIVGLGGVLLPFAAWSGLLEKIRAIKAAPGHRRALLTDPGFAVAMTLLLGFLLAALLRGQIKGNWLLPGFVLLWPVAWQKVRTWQWTAVAFSLLLSALMATAMHTPDLVAGLESRARFVRNLYQQQAGDREARVSRTRSWSQRLQEYHPLTEFAGSVAACWFRSTSARSIPRWIISDDYGLAAQLAFAWREHSPRIIIPNDGIFFRTLPSDTCRSLQGGILLMAVRTTCDRLWQRLPNRLGAGTVHHPQAGIAVAISGEEKIRLVLPTEAGPE